MRIAINGMGRIGRLLFKYLIERVDLELVAVNDIMPLDNLVYLLKYDSISGPYNRTIRTETEELIVAGRHIRVFNEADPRKLAWKDWEVDLVVESTGAFTSTAGASKHLEAGAQQVLLTTTGASDLPLVILGVNGKELQAAGPIISPGGCMTNCSANILGILMEEFGIASVQMNILHAYTSRQSLVDGAHRNWRRGRSAPLSIIPVEIDLAGTLERLFPALKDCIAATSTRVPVANGAFADFSIVLKKETTAAGVNDLFRAEAEGRRKGILQYTEEMLVSADILGNPHSGIVDGTLTSMVKDHLKLGVWFDNEYGYTNRILDIIDALERQFKLKASRI